MLALWEILATVIISNQRDRWFWSLDGSDEFSVASARKYINSKTLVVDHSSTRWNTFVPIKVNIFTWRLSLNKIPIRDNLDKRGIDIHSLLCPVCDLEIETVRHLFFSCQMARDIWKNIGRWWALDIPDFNSNSDWIGWFLSLRLKTMELACLEAVVQTALWAIWVFEMILFLGFLSLRKGNCGIRLSLFRSFGLQIGVVSLLLIG